MRAEVKLNEFDSSPGISGRYSSSSLEIPSHGRDGSMHPNTKTTTEQRGNWHATLSSRQRVLLHTQPILQMRQHWSQRDDIDAGYDPLCLSMKLFDVVIDQSGFGHEVVRQTIADALTPLLVSLDAAAKVAPDRQRHQRVLDRLLNGHE